MKRLICSALSAALCIVGTVSAQTSWTIYSPDSTVQATVQLANLNGTADYPNSTRLYYSVSHGRPTATEVVPTSPMGIVRSDRNFVNNLSFVSESAQRRIDENYTMVTGKRSACRNYCNEKTLTFTVSGSQLQVIIRAYNNGFAFRYRFPETSGSTYTVTGEESGIRMPSSATTCIMPYDIFSTWQNGYENYWNNNIAVGTRVSQVTICGDGADGWALPALFRTPSGHYALFFETDVDRAFCGMHLREPSSLVYRLALPLSAEANRQGSVNPSWTLPWTMPWRVVCVGATPADILENTLATDLATPSVVSNTSWITPGRASWSWWSNEDVTRYSNVTPFIDLADQMNWEYSLVDVGWPNMTGGTWRDLVSYGASRGVSIILWYNSGGSHNTVSGMPPRDRMLDANRTSELNTISSAGVKGIKVDFFHADKQWIIQYYLDILADAANYQIAVNFHGCTVPRGWQRTYPNLMTMESVRGEEYYKYDGGYPAGQPVRNTILPFTRNAVASMDFTPVGFSSMANPHQTTYGHELALSVVFESGIQHFCDRVSAYTSRSANIRNFMSTVPAAWDDTRYLLGTPGTYLVLARRKGYDWYIGGINGRSSSQNVTVPLSFLQAGPDYQMLRIADGSSNTTFSEQTGTVTSSSSINVSMRARGGFVARLINQNPVALLPDMGKVRVCGIANKSTFRCASERFAIPKQLYGKTFTLAVYTLDGRRVASKLFADKRTVNLRKEMGVRQGVHLLRIITP